MEKNKILKLLMVGTSNWNFYYDFELKCVMSIAKEGPEYKGCKDSIFGSMNYFRNWLKRELKKYPEKECLLTANGFRALNSKEII